MAERFSDEEIFNAINQGDKAWDCPNAQANYLRAIAKLLYNKSQEKKVKKK